MSETNAEDPVARGIDPEEPGTAGGGPLEEPSASRVEPPEPAEAMTPVETPNGTEASPEAEAGAAPPPLPERVPAADAGLEAEPVPDTELAPVAEPVPDAELAPVAEPVPDAELAPVAEPVPEPEPEPASAAETAPRDEVAPLEEPTPAGEPEPAAVEMPAAAAEIPAEVMPRAGGESDTEPAPTAESEPAPEPAPEPVAESEPAPEPALGPEPSGAAIPEFDSASIPSLDEPPAAPGPEPEPEGAPPRPRGFPMPRPTKKIPVALPAMTAAAVLSVALSLTAVWKANTYRAQLEHVSRIARDPANLGHFRESNVRLMQEGGYKPGTLTIIYGADMGEEWKMLHVLGPKNVVNRSIMGQNTTQLMLRAEQDVVSLAPMQVVLLPPLRDVVRPRQILLQMRILGETFLDSGILPVLATIPPIPAESDSASGAYVGRIITVNRGLKELGERMGWPVIDLFAPLAGDHNYLRREFVGEDAWPNQAGYRVLTETLSTFVDSLYHLDAIASGAAADGSGSALPESAPGSRTAGAPSASHPAPPGERRVAERPPGERRGP